MKKNPLFSIIIPVRHPTAYLRETLSQLRHQSLKKFEILVITDKISKNPHPALKRNLGAKLARGRFLAFLDDDSYPDQHWLNNAQKIFRSSPQISAVCGPCLTPPSDDVFKQASGLVWSSRLGSGGAGVYRNSISPRRFVDDFPSVNLIVRKTDFWKIGGFKTRYWPGEDTLLCLDLTKKLKKKIAYDPSIIVYHHRRSVVLPHLQQITRYAIHRGQFAKKFPATSRRLGYFIPSLFLVYLCSLPLTHFFFPVFIYLLFLILTFFTFILHRQNVLSSLLAIITIPLTHLYYGLLFLIGFFRSDIQFLPHQTDKITGNYVGG